MKIAGKHQQNRKRKLHVSKKMFEIIIIYLLLVFFATGILYALILSFLSSDSRLRD